MAVTLEELELKFKSEIAAAGSKDEAALARVDAAVRRSGQGLEKLQSAHARYAAAARVAEGSGHAGKIAKAHANETGSAQKLSDALGKHAELVAAKPKLLELAKSSAHAKESVKSAKEQMRDMGRQARIVLGPLGDLGGRFKALAPFADEGAKACVALGAMALGVAVVAGATAAYVALVKFGFGAAGAARDARILGEALTGSAALGAEFNAVVNQLAGKVPLAKAQIASLAQEFSLLKLGRRDLQAGLTSVAIVTSALGESAGGAVKSIVEASAASRRFSLGMRDRFGELTGLAGTGLKKADVLGALAKQLGRSVPEVEKQLLSGRIAMADGLKALEAAAQGRFGKTLAAQMLSFDTQIDKAKERLSGMFRDVNIEPALQGLKSVLSVLDESTVTGQGLKAVLTAGIGDIAKGIGAAAPFAKSFFQGMIIGALQTYLVLRPIGRAIQGLVGPLATAKNAAIAGKIVFYGLAAAFGIIALAVAGVTASVAAMAAFFAGAVAAALAPFVAIGYAIKFTGETIGDVAFAIVSSVQAAWDWLADSAEGAGSRLIDGIVGAIKAGVGRVVGAVKGLAESAASAFTSANEIHSPSRRWARYARYNVEGLVQQYERDTPEVATAVEGLGDAAPALPSGAGPRAGGGGGNVYNITTGDVYFSGKKASGAEKQDLLDWLLEQIAGAQGAGNAGRMQGAT